MDLLPPSFFHDSEAFIKEMYSDEGMRLIRSEEENLKSKQQKPLQEIVDLCKMADLIVLGLEWIKADISNDCAAIYDEGHSWGNKIELAL